MGEYKVSCEYVSKKTKKVVIVHVTVKEVFKSYTGQCASVSKVAVACA